MLNVIFTCLIVPICSAIFQIAYWHSRNGGCINYIRRNMEYLLISSKSQSFNGPVGLTSFEYCIRPKLMHKLMHTLFKMQVNACLRLIVKLFCPWFPQMFEARMWSHVWHACRSQSPWEETCRFVPLQVCQSSIAVRSCINQKSSSHFVSILSKG